MCYNSVLEDVKPQFAFQAAGCCRNGSFWPKDLHLQCVLGNPRTGGVRSCNWYCRKELVLEVGRVNEPGNRIWLKMGLNRKPQVQKEVPGFLGFGKGVDSFPLSFPPGLLLSVFLVFFLVRSGKYKFRAIRGVDFLPWLSPRIGFRV